jgi:preprotein translocase subunit YajC
MKSVLIIVLAIVLLVPISVFATDGYVSSPDKNIKITYSKIIESEFGDTVIGTVKNISDQQVDKIIIKIGEHTSRFLEHSTMPYISSLRPNESSYFVIPIDSLTNCYELEVLSYSLDSSTNAYQGQETQIFDNLSINSTEITHNGIFGTIKNMDERTKSIQVLIVAYYDEQIVSYGLSQSYDQIKENKTFDFGYWMLPEEYQGADFDNMISYDAIAKFDVVDYTDSIPGTKFDKFYPLSQIHKSPNLSEIPFVGDDYRVNNCDNLEDTSQKTDQGKFKIPSWIKNNAKWWSEDQVDDVTFTQGIGFLIKEKIIAITDLPEQSSNVSEEKVPEWIKNNAKWWADGSIDDESFVTGIKYLVENGIIQVK